MNHIDTLIHDWGWWNRAYTRLLIRLRGYHLVKMVKTLPVVGSVGELTLPENGAMLWLEPRQSSENFRAPTVALGEHAAYVVDYYKKQFAPRQERPFLAYFQNPVLYGRQYSILDSQRHAFEECFIRDRRWREGVPKKKQSPKKIDGTFLLAGTEFQNHFAHLLCDVLTRWKLFEEVGLAGKIPALLPPPGPGFAEESWQKLGLTGGESKRWDDGCWQMDGLYFASTFKKFDGWTPESARWLRSKMAPGIESNPVGKKLLFISRSGGARALLNEDKILQSLKAYDLIVVQPEKLSLQKQIELFADAGLIVGPLGAGLQNSVWAPRGCRVLSLVNPRYFSGTYWTLAESLAQPNGIVAGSTEAGDDPQQDGYSCDPDLVKQAIDQLCAN